MGKLSNTSLVWAAILAIVSVTYWQRGWQPMKDFLDWAGNGGVAVYLTVLVAIGSALTAWIWKQPAKHPRSDEQDLEGEVVQLVGQPITLEAIRKSASTPA